MEERLLKLKTSYLTRDLLDEIYKDYSNPADKIKNLVKSGDLNLIKRELYLLGEKYQKSYSKECIANLIYGPSAISFEYALSYHNLIPERVETITSICFKRNKEFHTPIGMFTYRYLQKELFSVGLELHTSPLGNFFMATPEKALCDMAYHEKLSQDEVRSFIVENLRIEEEDFIQLRTELLLQIAEIYRRPSVMNLVKAQISLKGK